MHVTAIVLAAGKGLRFKFNPTGIGLPMPLKEGLKVSKPLVEIDSQALIVYSLKALSENPDIKDIIVVVNSANSKGIKAKLEQHRIPKIQDVVLGGVRRQDSVYCGLKSVSCATDMVLIHDGARPFIDTKSLALVIRKAAKSGAAILGVPVKATIKEVSSSGLVKKTINRGALWEIQTPQVFKKELILEAYRKFRRLSVTDDSMLVEKLGAKVSMVLGTYHNIKITTPEDLLLAEAIAKKLIRKRNL